MTKKLYQYEFNKINPFLDETVYQIDKGQKVILLGNKKSDMLIDNETGEVKAHTVFAKRIDIDKTEFRKIYVKSLAAWFDLSKTGIRIFAYILSVLKPNADSFMIDYDECMEFTKYKTRKSIADGIKELIENQFIARGKNQYLYFINPTIFFNGDRITFLKQFNIQDNPKLKPIDDENLDFD